MGHQETIFLTGEGDQWYQRNKDKARTDPVFDATEEIGLKPRYVTEVGCGTGWRLARYVREYKSFCCGIDPSHEAIKAGNKAWEKHGRHIELYRGTASGNIASTRPSDLFIFGFCLYLCDPEDLPRIVYEADNNLIDGGHMVIHDFDPDYPHRLKYHHVDGLFSYKMNYAKLWLANPAYTLVRKNVFENGTAVWVLKKDISAGWPEQVMP